MSELQKLLLFSSSVKRRFRLFPLPRNAGRYMPPITFRADIRVIQFASFGNYVPGVLFRKIYLAAYAFIVAWHTTSLFCRKV